MFVRESTPLPCGPAFIGLRHSPLNVGLAAGVVALQHSSFNGPATLALATSGIFGGATLAYFVQAHFNRRILAAPVNITSGKLYHTAVVHPACPLGSSSLSSGDVLDNFMCTPFNHGGPGPTCDPLSQMHTLELDNWFSTEISSCEAGDAPGTDLIVSPVPPTSPLSSCTDVGKCIPGDMIIYGTGERGISVYHGATCTALDTVGDPELSAHFLAISPHVILVFTVFTCLCLALVLLLITCHMTRISSYFIRRGVRNIPVASPSSSVPVDEESKEEEFFSLPSTPSHLDFAPAEAIPSNPVEDQNASSFVDAELMASESEQEAAAPVEESVSEEARLSNDQGVEENLNEEIISSVELDPIADEAPSSTVSGALNPTASPFVPSVLGLPAATTSATLETVDDDIPPIPSAIPTHISARPPGRRRRKHHRKNKGRVVENILVG